MFVQVYKASLRAQDCLRAINWAVLTTSWLLLMRAETAKGLSQINHLYCWSSGNIHTQYMHVETIQDVDSSIQLPSARCFSFNLSKLGLGQLGVFASSPRSL